MPPPAALEPDGDLTYRIAASDKITVSVANLPELEQREILVDSGGRVSIPLVGAVQVGGLTRSEAQELIEARLRQAYVRAPQVSINLIESSGQVVTVDGEVTQPGLYPVIGQLSLIKAVALAKGTAKYARLEDVVVFRTVGGRKMAALYNLGAIRRGAYEDPAIYPNDVVVVGQSRARQLFDTLLQVAPLLSTPLVVFLQSN